MRAHLLILPLLCLTACEKVGKNPWAHVDYAEANCGTKAAVLTTTGCNVAPAANPVTAVIPVKNANNNSEDEMSALDNNIRDNKTDVYGSNANTTVHGTNADNSVHGTDNSNDIHGNNGHANVWNGTTNNNSTTTVIGSNLDNYHTNTGVYGQDNNTGSVYGNNANEGNSTSTGVNGPVTGVYGANGTNSTK